MMSALMAWSLLCYLSMPGQLYSLINLLYALAAFLLLPACTVILQTASAPATRSLTQVTDADCLAEFNDMKEMGDQVSHPNSAEDAEHAAAEALVDYGKVTAIACRDGNISDPAIWNGRILPSSDSRVLIMPGRTVVVDGIIPTRFKTIRVDGTLKFDETTDTHLLFETMFVSPEGSLEVGTQEAPIAVGVTAKLTIADNPIDLIEDPSSFGHGIVAHGALNVFGAKKTAFVSLVNYPSAGATRLSVDVPPVGWQPGDRLVFPGTNDAAGMLDEELTVTSVSGNQIGVSPLKYDHAPRPGYPRTLPVYLANLSRNVVFESENRDDVTRRGHLMVMHSPRGNLNYALFQGLGRTLTQDMSLNYLDRAHKTVPRPFDPISKVPSPPPTNPKGRYAVHFHRTGIDPKTSPNVVRGCVVEDTLKWGYVNHSSNVNFDDNIAYNGQGVQFQTEAGDEIGAFRNNLAIRTTGNWDELVRQQPLPLMGSQRDTVNKVDQVFGVAGNGFWFEGPTLTISGNIAVGQASAGFVFYPEGLVEKDLGEIMIPLSNLSDPTVPDRLPPSIVSGTTIPPAYVPYNVGSSTVYNSQSGFVISNSSSVDRNSFTGLLSWSAPGFGAAYTGHVSIKDSSLYGDPGYGGLGLDWLQDLLLDNLHLEQFNVGVYMLNLGQATIKGGYYDNGISFWISHPTCGAGNQCRRTITFEGVQLGTSYPTSGGQHYALFYPGASTDQNMYAGYQQFDKNSKNYMQLDHYAWNLFLPDTILWKESSTSAPTQLYYTAQTASFAYPAGFVIPQLAGLTGDQIKNQYHLMMGDALAPAQTSTRDDFFGFLLGAPTSTQDPLEVSVRYLPDQATTPFRMTDAAFPQMLPFTTTVNILPDWNFLSVTDGSGASRTILLPGPKVIGP